MTSCRWLSWVIRLAGCLFESNEDTGLLSSYKQPRIRSYDRLKKSYTSVSTPYILAVIAFKKFAFSCSKAACVCIYVSTISFFTNVNSFSWKLFISTIAESSAVCWLTTC
jgi:hypothetical protein